MAAPIADVLRLLAALGFANLTRNQLLPAPLPITAVTASISISPAQGVHPCGTLFTNRGAAGAVTITLPSVGAVPVGTWYEFQGVVAQNIILATVVADTFLTVNDVAADTVTISTASQIIGARCRVVNDGTQWMFEGSTVGITYTVAT